MVPSAPKLVGCFRKSRCIEKIMYLYLSDGRNWESREHSGRAMHACIGVLETCITSYLGQYLQCIVKISDKLSTGRYIEKTAGLNCYRSGSQHVYALKCTAMMLIYCPLVLCGWLLEATWVCIPYAYSVWNTATNYTAGRQKLKVPCICHFVHTRP